MVPPMNEPTPLPRSPEMMSPEDTGLLVVDVQERLVPAISGHRHVVWNVRRLIDGAKILFSMRPPDGRDRNIYEINADGTGLRQITSGGGVAGPCSPSWVCWACCYRSVP